MMLYWVFYLFRCISYMLSEAEREEAINTAPEAPFQFTEFQSSALLREAIIELHSCMRRQLDVNQSNKMKQRPKINKSMKLAEIIEKASHISLCLRGSGVPIAHQPVSEVQASFWIATLWHITPPKTEFAHFRFRNFKKFFYHSTLNDSVSSIISSTLLVCVVSEAEKPVPCNSFHGQKPSPKFQTPKTTLNSIQMSFNTSHSIGTREERVLQLQILVNGSSSTRNRTFKFSCWFLAFCKLSLRFDDIPRIISYLTNILHSSQPTVVLLILK